MVDYEMILQMDKIYERLQDLESRKIFESKISLMIDGDRDRFWNRIKDNKKWYAFNLNSPEYFVFGAGKMGRHIKKQLETVGKKVRAFLDNDDLKIGRFINGTPVIKVNDAEWTPEIPIVFSSRQYEEKMKEQLIRLEIKNPTVKEEEICLFCGTQYFDVFQANNNEIFIDAGAYDGGTIKDFIQWCGGNYDMIYAFEPDILNYEKCKRFIAENHIDRIKLFQKGTFSTETVLQFAASGDGGATVKEDGTSKIETAAIDSVLNRTKATFIKMDVEGSEIESLYGARQTIEKYKPRLAICVYHKDLDFVEIPFLLLEMNPDYKFYLRHYASNLCETVLYAV